MSVMQATVKPARGFKDNLSSVYYNHSFEASDEEGDPVSSSTGTPAFNKSKNESENVSAAEKFQELPLQEGNSQSTSRLDSSHTASEIVDGARTKEQKFSKSRKQRLLRMNKRSMSVEHQEKNTGQRRKRMQRSSTEGGSLSPMSSPNISPSVSQSFDIPSISISRKDLSAAGIRFEDAFGSESNANTDKESREKTCRTRTQSDVKAKRPSMKKLLRYSTFDDKKVYMAEIESRSSTLAVKNPLPNKEEGTRKIMQQMKRLSLIRGTNAVERFLERPLEKGNSQSSLYSDSSNTMSENVSRVRIQEHKLPESRKEKLLRMNKRAMSSPVQRRKRMQRSVTEAGPLSPMSSPNISPSVSQSLDIPSDNNPSMNDVERFQQQSLQKGSSQSFLYSNSSYTASEMNTGVKIQERKAPESRKQRLLHMNKRAMSVDDNKKNTGQRRKRMQRSSTEAGSLSPMSSPIISPSVSQSLDVPSNSNSRKDGSLVAIKSEDASTIEITVSTNGESKIKNTTRNQWDVKAKRPSMRKLVRYSTFDDRNIYMAENDSYNSNPNIKITSPNTGAGTGQIMEQMKGLSLVGRMRGRMERNYSLENEECHSHQTMEVPPKGLNFLPRENVNRKRSSSLPDSINSIGSDDVEDPRTLFLPRRMAICPDLQVPAMKQLKSYLVTSRLRQYCLT